MAKNTPGMIGATAAMGFIVGQYGVATILFVAPQSGLGGGTLVSLLLPLAVSAVGALIGVMLTRSVATAGSSGRSDWGQVHTA
ncbi:MAG: hypothetical protein EXQ88_06925 [Alphaproteobacteria bacterium]|nr:hypothetical protein [Alphaproteobacteria bacterium]